MGLIHIPKSIKQAFSRYIEASFAHTIKNNSGTIRVHLNNPILRLHNPLNDLHSILVRCLTREFDITESSASSTCMLLECSTCIA